ncbi:MAG: hypothetical protein RLZZ524_3123 [Pseudomonadota bacterium]|jgi:hypothetical protein
MAVTLYWIVQADATATPTGAQIVAGQDGTGSAALASGSEAYTSAGNYSEASAISSLSAGTAYEQAWVAYDGSTYSTVVTATITTASIGNAVAAVGYAVRSSGSATAAVGYPVRASGSATLAAGFSVNASSSATAAVGYAIRSSSSATAAVGFEVQASAGVGSAIAAVGYAVREAGSATASVGFAVRFPEAAARLLHVGYAVRASGSATLGAGYAINAASWATLAAGFEIRAAGSDTVPVGYVVRSAGSAAVDVGFGVGFGGFATLPVGFRVEGVGAAGAADVWAYVLSNGKTAEETLVENNEMLRIIMAAVAGKSAGVGTATETYFGADGITPRVIATFDSAGNRATVITDGTP